MRPDSWEVTGLGSNGKPVGAPVYVYARTEAGAIRAGRSALRMFRTAKVFELRARPWNPEQDVGMQRFVKPMPASQQRVAGVR